MDTPISILFYLKRVKINAQGLAPLLPQESFLVIYPDQRSTKQHKTIGLYYERNRMCNFSKSTTNDIPHPFLVVLCEYKVAPVVGDDPPLDAKDVLFLNW